MRTTILRSALCLALCLSIGACEPAHDNILDPEHEGSLSIDGPSVLQDGEQARYDVRSSTSGISDLPFVWTSNAPARLRFNLGGIATGVSAGPVTIRAQYFDIVLTATVTVQ